MQLRHCLAGLFLSIGVVGGIKAQVQRKIVVEHFTNTLCSVCASRNPGFYSNLNNQSGVIHISYHPSSPYSGCVHSQHNVSGNDGRTNYYGIYGSTPRLVIQGANVSTSANYGSATIFNGFTGQTSPVSLQVKQQLSGNDSIYTQVVVKTISMNSLTGLSIYVALAEDTIFYAAPNGESQQLRVFRKALSPNAGQALSLPAVGDSIVLQFSSAIHTSWVSSRMFSIAILQQTSNKSVIQAERSTSVGTLTGFSSQEITEVMASVYPNPVVDRLVIAKKDHELLTVHVLSMNGQLLKNKQFYEDGFVDLTDIPKGLYLVRLIQRNGVYTQKVIKQ